MTAFQALSQAFASVNSVSILGLARNQLHNLMHQELQYCRSAKSEEAVAASQYQRFNRSSLVHWFLWSAAAILALTGLGKISSAFGSAQVLAIADPIVGIPFRVLLPLTGSVELIIAALCVWKRFPQRSRLLLVAWVSTMFVFYRISLWAMDWRHPCGCMGSLAGVLHMSDPTADSVVRGLLGYLYLGSYTLFVASNVWRSHTNQSELKL